MDASQIGIVVTSLNAAKDIAKAMMGIRDFNLVAGELAALNEQLLKAQNALLAHSAAMFELQSKHFETCEELRKLKEAASERSRYALVRIGSSGHLAYRMDIAPQEGAAGEPSATQASHYICQACYDNGRKVVLQPHVGFDGMPYGYRCPVCTDVFPP